MDLPELIKSKYGDRFQIYEQSKGNIIGIGGSKAELEAELKFIIDLASKHGYKQTTEIYNGSGMKTFDSNDVIYTFIKL